MKSTSRYNAVWRCHRDNLKSGTRFDACPTPSPWFELQSWSNRKSQTSSTRQQVVHAYHPNTFLHAIPTLIHSSILIALSFQIDHIEHYLHLLHDKCLIPVKVTPFFFSIEELLTNMKLTINMVFSWVFMPALWSTKWYSHLNLNLPSTQHFCLFRLPWLTGSYPAIDFCP